MSQNEITRIAQQEVQEYIFSNSIDDEKQLILQRREVLGVSTALIAQQIAVRRKAKVKLPLLFNTKGIVYPPSVNWEQCSSQATGNFKADIISKEIGTAPFKVADLTGGFGMDSFFLSKKAAFIDYIEPDPTLLDIARHNHKLLDSTNIHYHQTTAEKFLDQCKIEYDLMYLDPSRRDMTSKKVYRLTDCQPDVASLLPQIFTFAEFALIKASPLLDLHRGLTELTSVRNIIVVSVNNECKELLFLLQKEFFGEPSIETYNVDKLGVAKQVFAFTFNGERNIISEFGEPQTYLYEPNASILKAGAFKSVGEKFGLQKVHINTHFFTSQSFKPKFPGRVFKIEQLEFKAKNFVEKKANVISRNYPLSAVELKKKLKLSDGGEKYVIGFSGLKKKYVVLATRLV